MTESITTPTVSSDIATDYRTWVETVVREMFTRKHDGKDIEHREIETLLTTTKADNAFVRGLVVTKHKLISAADFDRMARNKIIVATLGENPDTASRFLEIIANRRSMVVHYSGAIEQSPDMCAPYAGETIGAALAMIEENKHDLSLGRMAREIESMFPRQILRTEFENELRVMKDNLGLPFQDSQIRDAATLWVTNGKKNRVFDIAERLHMEPGVPNMVSTVADPMWRDLALKVFDTTEMSPDLVIAVLKKFVWQVKRKLANLTVTNHLMPVILGPQGSGKSTFVHRFVKPLEDLMATTDFDQITDKRNIDLWRNYVLFLDEMAHAQRADIDAVKNAITASSLSRRPMRENSTEIVPQRATFIGCSNKELSQLVNDTTGNRRFFPLRMPRDACRTTVNTIDFTMLWCSVDLHAADPMLPFMDVAAGIQAEERSLSSVEKWLEDFTPKARHGVNGSTFEELVRGKRIAANDLFKLYSEWEAIHHPSGYRFNVQNFGSEMKRLLNNSPEMVPFKKVRASSGNVYEYTGNIATNVVPLVK